MGASLGAARGPSRRAPELVRDRFNSQAATASWGRPKHYPHGVDLAPLYDHLTAPRGRGRSLSHSAEAGGAPCGDLVRIHVDIRGDRVTNAGFDASGCAAARAAGSATVELVAGAPFLDAARITPEAIAEELGGLSPERMHAAHLAADALHRALGQGAPQLPPDPNRVLVAMSGGVDSAVAAQRAVEEGHDVAAVTLELWADPRTDGTKSCCSPHAVVHARALAHRMGLPHVTLDVRDAFRATVVDDYVHEHEAGRTPNPCVRCNGHVRFDAMLALAGKLGAARLATGHYARITADEHGPLLRAGADPAKDQSYMLARIKPDELERLWFPLGELTKPQVREIARQADLPVAEKPESQDLCFLAGTDLDDFVTRRDPGHIVDEAGRTLAHHGGQHRFTVGQRRGIGVAGPEPLYVLRKEGSRVVVGTKSALATTSVSVAGAILFRDGTEVDSVKLRYRSRPAACTITHDAPPGRHRNLTLDLQEPAHGVAPGQTACLMRGDAVIGFATIAPSRTRPAHTPTSDMELSHAR
jgi:tRNA-uridine 2-sulfurtransferase